MRKRIDIVVLVLAIVVLVVVVVVRFAGWQKYSKHPIATVAPTSVVMPAPVVEKCCCCCDCCKKTVVTYPPPPVKKKVVVPEKLVPPPKVATTIATTIPPTTTVATTVPSTTVETTVTTTVATTILPPTPASECRDGRKLVMNTWSRNALPEDIRKKTDDFIEVAKHRGGIYKTDDVSRQLGRRLREEVKVRFPIDTTVQLRYLDPKTFAVEWDLGEVRFFSGTTKIHVPRDPRQYITEITWAKNFISPTLSSGERRLWVFPDEWGNSCEMNVHGIVP